MKTIIIAAISKNHVIGNQNKLIWHLSADLKRFKELTLGHCVLMGRKTFESIGKPLPGRKNIIITRNRQYLEKNKDIEIASSLKEAISLAKTSLSNKAFIIGGGEIYKEAIKIADLLEITQIEDTFEGDTFFPFINLNYWIETKKESFLKDNKNPYSYHFISYKRKKGN